jgi:hypothetical protein
MEPDVTKIVIHLNAISGAFLAEESKAQQEDRFLSTAQAQRIFTRCRAALDRYAPAGSVYLDDAQGIIEQQDSASLIWQTEQLLAVVEALRDDYQAGAMQSVAELVHADVFDDLLVQAAELLDKNYLGAATVVAGAVLEEQLHKLAAKQSIALRDANNRPKSFEDLSVELRKAGVLTEPQRKTVAAWYAQRNEAAHGKFEGLHSGDVERMIDGVRDFVARHPA